MWGWNNQHVTSVGQRKNLNPGQDSNLWPPKHRAGALSTELRVLYPQSNGCSIHWATGALSSEQRVLYPLSYGCSIHWVTGALSSEFSVAQWIERPPGVWEVIGSNPVRDSDFFFVPRSWNDDYFIFIYIYIYILQLRPLTKQHKNIIVNSTY